MYSATSARRPRSHPVTGCSAPATRWTAPAPGSGRSPVSLALGLILATDVVPHIGPWLSAGHHGRRRRPPAPMMTTSTHRTTILDIVRMSPSPLRSARPQNTSQSIGDVSPSPADQSCRPDPDGAADLARYLARRRPHRSGPGNVVQLPVRRVGPRARRWRHRELGRERVVQPPSAPGRGQATGRVRSGAGRGRTRPLAAAAAGRAHLPPPPRSRPSPVRPSPARASGRPPGRLVGGIPASTRPRSGPTPSTPATWSAWPGWTPSCLKATLYSGSQIPGGGPSPTRPRPASARHQPGRGLQRRAS